ncbi:intraflagellar transport protein 22 homolog isoform X3 [Diaphorina citri]|uniref:Intraflagellar transport protein 22 homolog isoform X3 n=1 Tax=Diaphorina citri TaxID=121845 RepID=A0A1S3D0I5_DIACI|nr:intraflagellar transport protein 22 homolog isoform X3 [Diaphorina citri]
MKIKILILGPIMAGKTVLANALCDLTTAEEYHPTQGVRIVECEHSYALDTSKTEIELWDTSGDHKFESVWPAFQRDVHGIIFVFNSGVPGHISELLLFYDYFVTQSDLNNHKCLLIDNVKPGRGDSSGHAHSLPKQLAPLQQKRLNIKTEDDILKREFNQFVSSLIRSVQQSSHSVLNIL